MENRSKQRRVFPFKQTVHLSCILTTLFSYLALMGKTGVHVRRAFLYKVKGKVNVYAWHPREMLAQPTAFTPWWLGLFNIERSQLPGKQYKPCNYNGTKSVSTQRRALSLQVPMQMGGQHVTHFLVKNFLLGTGDFCFLQ